jgi:hypothetical protein
MLVLLSVPIVIQQAFGEYVDLYGTSFLIIGLALFLSRGDHWDARRSRFQNAVLLLFSSLSFGV